MIAVLCDSINPATRPPMPRLSLRYRRVFSHECGTVRSAGRQPPQDFHCLAPSLSGAGDPQLSCRLADLLLKDSDAVLVSAVGNTISLVFHDFIRRLMTQMGRGARCSNVVENGPCHGCASPRPSGVLRGQCVPITVECHPIGQERCWMPRLLIVLMFSVLFVVSGALLSIPLIVRNPLPIVGIPGSAVFEELNGEVATKLELQVETGGRFALVLTAAGQDPPGIGTLYLRMLDHEMPPLALRSQTNSNHEYRAAGRFPMPGRWEVLVRKGDERQAFRFILRE